jgi:hypothetical protein
MNKNYYCQYPQFLILRLETTVDILSNKKWKGPSWVEKSVHKPTVVDENKL